MMLECQMPDVSQYALPHRWKRSNLGFSISPKATITCRWQGLGTKALTFRLVDDRSTAWAAATHTVVAEDAMQGVNMLIRTGTLLFYPEPHSICTFRNSHKHTNWMAIRSDFGFSILPKDNAGDWTFRLVDSLLYLLSQNSVSTGFSSLSNERVVTLLNLCLVLLVQLLQLIEVARKAA